PGERRAGPSEADGASQAGFQDVPDQRGDGPGAEDRRGRHVHHVEGARRDVAERGRAGAGSSAEGGRGPLRLRLRDPEERAQQDRGIRVSRRDAGAVGPDRLRGDDGLQPDRVERQGARRRRQAHRLHQGRAGAAARAELRLHRQERQPAQRVVGQDLQGLTRPRRSVAGVLLGPATLAVVLGLLVPLAILFRYSFNRFVPGRLMLESLTSDTYVQFLTYPYYLPYLLAIIVHPLGCPSFFMVLCLFM